MAQNDGRGGAIWPRPFRRSEPLLHQGNFVIVDFQFTNEGNESKTLTQQALQLENYSGRTSAPDPADFRYIPKDRNIFLKQVNLGVTQQGQVIFTIASRGYRIQDTAPCANSGRFRPS